MLPACEIPTLIDQVYTVGITTHGHTIGGIGIVDLAGTSADPATVDAGRWSLMLLSPSGLALFTASGPPASVTTGIPAWGPSLARLPFERDLLLAFVVGDACATGGGTIRPRGTRTRWRGPGGRAHAVYATDRVTIHDPMRGYTLTLVPAVPDPSEADAVDAP